MKISQTKATCQASCNLITSSVHHLSLVQYINFDMYRASRHLITLRAKLWRKLSSVSLSLLGYLHCSFCLLISYPRYGQDTLMGSGWRWSSNRQVMMTFGYLVHRQLQGVSVKFATVTSLIPNNPFPFPHYKFKVSDWWIVCFLNHILHKTLEQLPLFSFNDMNRWWPCVLGFLYADNKITSGLNSFWKVCCGPSSSQVKIV